MAGVDTLGFTAPITRNIFSSRRMPSGCLIRGFGDGVWLEASLPRILRGSNLVPLVTAEAFEAVDVILREAREYVDITSAAPEDLRITRLDIAHDFKSGNLTDRLISAAQFAKRTPRQKFELQGHGKTIESFIVPKKSWRGTLYDKSRQTQVTDIELLRFEARLRRPALPRQWVHRNEFRVEYLSDLTDERLDAMGRATFKRCGFDTVKITEDHGITLRFNWDTREVISPL